MELQLGLALPTNLYPCKNSHKKRSFTQLLDFYEHDDQVNNREVLLPTLSLLPLTPVQPNDENNNYRSNCSSAITKNDWDDNKDALVGWPPLNSWRKRLRYDINYAHEEGVENYQMVWVDNSHHHHHHHHNGQYGSVGITGSNNTSLYVKVKMEGVGIARKVDLSMHHSFHTLKQTLMDMFGKCHENSKGYELTYQDKEGDWLLADQDVPWRSFVDCAQRLKLVKSSG